jgi:hypothetical protein
MAGVVYNLPPNVRASSGAVLLFAVLPRSIKNYNVMYDVVLDHLESAGCFTGQLDLGDGRKRSLKIANKVHVLLLITYVLFLITYVLSLNKHVLSCLSWKT